MTKIEFEKPKVPLLESLLDLNKCLDYFAKLSDDPVKLQEKLNRGNTIQTILEVNEDQMKQLYQEAHQYFKAGDYFKAAEYFYALSLFDNTRFDFWFCLGHSLYFLERYTEALNAFAVAFIVNEEHPAPLFYIGICLLHLDKPKEAHVVFNETIEKAALDYTYHEWEEKATRFKKQLELGQI